MKFVFEGKPSDSPLVDTIWRTESEGGGSFISVAQTHAGIVITKQKGKMWLTVRGPETRATYSPIPDDAEFFGVVFKHGTFMPQFPARDMVDCSVDLPEAASKSFWLNGSAWEFPTYENVDTFIARLVRNGMLYREPLIQSALQGDFLRGQTPDLSLRSVQRRFVQSTGLSHNAIYQIERATQALDLLQQGVSILDTIDRLGYFDQPHLTKALRRFVGQTPAQILRLRESE